MTKIVYITGCLGFIGSYITRTCLELGWYVKGVDKITYALTILKKSSSLKQAIQIYCIDLQLIHYYKIIWYVPLLYSHNL